MLFNCKSTFRLDVHDVNSVVSFTWQPALLKIRRLILKKKEKERMSSRSKAEPIADDDEACLDTIRAS